MRQMIARLSHRGPDQTGHWEDPDRFLHLGHSRLSILDLSEAGRQPMLSKDNRYVLVFNGEIYNFRDLRKELENLGVSFVSTSDTEVLVSAIAQWGVSAACKKLHGMFAFAVWDRTDRLLTLVRDRVGIKPLYYGWGKQGFFFCSELRAIRGMEEFQNEVNPDVVALYLSRGFVPAPFSIFRNTYKLPAGTQLILREQDLATLPTQFSAFGDSERGALSPQGYWFKDEERRNLLSSRESGIDTEVLLREFDGLLTQAVQDRMIADVPLGAFLSGGIDSSLIVALMQKVSPVPIQSYSIGFHDEDFNEAKFAKQVSKALGTTHTEWYVTDQDCLDLASRMGAVYDEPFSDSSQIPTFLVCQLARKEVTVALSGDGGDELFAGYSRYLWAERLWSILGLWPPLVRTFSGHALRMLSPVIWNKLSNVINLMKPGTLPFHSPGQKIHTFSHCLEQSSFGEFYYNLLQRWRDAEGVVNGAKGIKGLHYEQGELSYLDYMMLSEFDSNLPDCLLTKVDRASMAHSLEVRVPFLDHRVVEFAWSIPSHYKRGRDGELKILPKALLSKYLPRALFERPKKGFSVPLQRWLRGPLRDWAEDLLSPSRVKSEGILDSEQISRVWKEHLNLTCDHSTALWSVLMLQSWLIQDIR